MTVQQDVLKRAAARIGYYAPNDPRPGSESGRYWVAKGKEAWLGGPSTSVWWCMLFVSMCLDEVGQIDSIGGFSYNTDVTLSRNLNRRVSVANAQPGDVVIFNWGFRGGTDHVGFVEKNLGGGWLQTIEGNTSSGMAGSQSAGNGVWRRRRNSDIAAIIRPNYKGVTGNFAQNIDADDAWWWGTAFTKKLQAYLGTPVDGIISDQAAGNKKYYPSAAQGWDWRQNPTEGSLMAKALQTRIGTDPDGFLGYNDAGALQRKLGVDVDHYVGSKTAKALWYAMDNKTL